jgi:broad specificity phosphatase PhoE
MFLLLARHGYTYEPGGPTFWYGSTEDVPLHAYGRMQAAVLGASINRAKIKLARVITGPLQRTQDTTSIALSYIAPDLKPAVFETDARLTEIHYGIWSGRPSADIAKDYPAEERAWAKHSVWPSNMGFAPSEVEVTAQVHGLATELAEQYGNSDDVCFLVSSNGLLRFFLKLVEGEWEKRCASTTFKLYETQWGLLEWKGGRWTLHNWRETNEQVQLPPR